MVSECRIVARTHEEVKTEGLEPRPQLRIGDQHQPRQDVTTTTGDPAITGLRVDVAALAGRVRVGDTRRARGEVATLVEALPGEEDTDMGRRRRRTRTTMSRIPTVTTRRFPRVAQLVPALPVQALTRTLTRSTTRIRPANAVARAERAPALATQVPIPIRIQKIATPDRKTTTTSMEEIAAGDTRPPARAHRRHAPRHRLIIPEVHRRPRAVQRLVTVLRRGRHGGVTGGTATTGEHTDRNERLNRRARSRSGGEGEGRTRRRVSRAEAIDRLALLLNQPQSRTGDEDTRASRGPTTGSRRPRRRGITQRRMLRR